MIFRTFFLLAWLGAGIGAYSTVPPRADRELHSKAALFALAMILAPVEIGFRAFKIMEAIGD